MMKFDDHHEDAITQGSEDSFTALEGDSTDESVTLRKKDYELWLKGHEAAVSGKKEAAKCLYSLKIESFQAGLPVIEKFGA